MSLLVYLAYFALCLTPTVTDIAAELHRKAIIKKVAV